MSRSRWNDKEIQLLTQLVQEQIRLSPYTIDWNSISSEIKTKSSAQCRVRYHNKTKFEQNNVTAKRIDWTENDDATIIKMAEEMSKNWLQISKILNITVSQVKNHYYFLMRGVNKLGKLEQIVK